MIALLAAFACLVQTATPAPQNEAEKLFRAMEKKFVDAKTVRVEYRAKLSGPAEGTVEGTLILGDKNQLHHRQKLDVNKDAYDALYVSDGTKLQYLSFDGTPEEDRIIHAPDPVGPLLRATYLCIITHAGFGAGNSLVSAQNPGQTDLHDEIKLSDFKMGAKQKRDGRDLQAVSYTMTHGEMPASVTLWIDVKSGLPAERSCAMSIPGMEKGMTMAETYPAIKLDEAVKPETFKLPDVKPTWIKFRCPCGKTITRPAWVQGAPECCGKPMTKE